MFKKKIFVIALLSNLGLLPLAQADEPLPDNRFYVAPFASFVKTGGDRKAADGWGGGLGVGKMLNKHFNVELRGFYQGFGGANGPWDLAGGTADLQYYFNRNAFAPYAVLALGGMHTCASANCGAGFIGEAGAGFTYEVADNFLVRSDVRYRYNNNFNANVQPRTNEFHDMVVNVGFVIPFGAKPKAVVPEIAVAAPPEPVVVAPEPYVPPVVYPKKQERE